MVFYPCPNNAITVMPISAAVNLVYSPSLVVQINAGIHSVSSVIIAVNCLSIMSTFSNMDKFIVGGTILSL